MQDNKINKISLLGTPTKISFKNYDSKYVLDVMLFNNEYYHNNKKIRGVYGINNNLCLIQYSDNTFICVDVCNNINFSVDQLKETDIVVYNKMMFTCDFDNAMGKINNGWAIKYKNVLWLYDNIYLKINNKYRKVIRIGYIDILILNGYICNYNYNYNYNNFRYLDNSLFALSDITDNYKIDNSNLYYSNGKPVTNNKIIDKFKDTYLIKVKEEGYDNCNIGVHIERKEGEDELYKILLIGKSYSINYYITQHQMDLLKYQVIAVKIIC